MFCLFKKLYLPLHKLILIRTINLAGKQLWSLVNEFYISKNVNLTEFKVLRIYSLLVGYNKYNFKTN